MKASPRANAFGAAKHFRTEKQEWATGKTNKAKLWQIMKDPQDSSEVEF